MIDLVNQFSNDDLNNIIALLNYLNDTNLIATLRGIVHVLVNKKEFTLSPTIVSFMRTVQDAADSVDSEKVIELPIANNNAEKLFAFIIDLIKQYDVSPLKSGEAMTLAKYDILNMIIKKPISYLVELLSVVNYLDVEKIIPIVISAISTLILEKDDLTVEEYAALDTLKLESVYLITDTLFKSLEQSILNQECIKRDKNPYLKLESKFLCFSGDSKRLFLLRNDNRIECIDLETKKIVNSIVLDFDVKVFELFSSNSNGSVIAFFSASNKFFYVWDTHQNVIKSIDFSNIKNTDINPENMLSLSAVKFSPDGKKIAIVFQDKLQNGKCLIILDGEKFTNITNVIHINTTSKNDIFSILGSTLVWSFDSQYVTVLAANDESSNTYVEFIVIYDCVRKISAKETCTGIDGCIAAFDDSSFVLLNDKKCYIYLIGIKRKTGIERENEIDIKLKWSLAADPTKGDYTKNTVVSSSANNNLLIITIDDEKYLLNMNNGMIFKINETIISFAPDGEGVWEIIQQNYQMYLYKSIITFNLQKECLKQLKSLPFAKRLKFIKATRFSIL